jgi:N,N-dimethylformamidase
MKKIVGYSDKISVRSGEDISFFASCEGGEPYKARIVRLIHGDTNPAGPGYKEESVVTSIDGTYQGREQAIRAGSYVVVPGHPLLAALESFTLQVMAWPTTPLKGWQSLIAHWDEQAKSGFILGIDQRGCLALRLGDGSGKVVELTSGKPMLPREWQLLAASYDHKTREVKLYQIPTVFHDLVDTASEVVTSVDFAPGHPGTALLMAAHSIANGGKGRTTAGHFNGKLDSPAIAKKALSRLDIERVLDSPASLRSELVARWDFAIDITSERVADIGDNRFHGKTVNLPARAMKGFNWCGREMSWGHAPNEYGAIHFHDDDLYDAGWDVDFTLTVPKELKSGIYAAHLQCSGDEDYIPFVVRPARGGPTAKIAFLVPTASYMAYANDHTGTDAAGAEMATGRLTVLHPEDVFLVEHREYGNSCYDVHSDGSGVCYSSRLRPILNMRPKAQGVLGGDGSSLWQLNADLHTTDWLEANGYEFDCVTDEDLHYEGLAAVSPYRVLLTGTHPEYWSKAMWEACDAYKRAGGRLMYMGANGWYWRIAYHPTKPGVMEVRRGEGGIRTWAAEPGEYYHSFTGEYGGLWRRQGLPPQMMAGTGFSAQGFDVSSYYRRQPGSFDDRAKFIFAGIGDDELIGDFGLIGGGAAGLELDRADALLGTPPNALVLASSEDHTDIYMVVCEELLTNTPGMSGQESPLVRADLVFYETPAGGAVFSVSSIAWAGSLSHNNYQNNVSRITSNVLERFLDPEPFCEPAVSLDGSR